MQKLLWFLPVLIVSTLFLFPKESSFDIRPVRQISGIVVPHHDLVKAQRAEFFDEVAEQISPPKTVIIVSPNHAQSGFGTIQTTDKTWNLSNGVLEPNREVVSSITSSPARMAELVQPGGFQNEHGIYLVLPDIHRVWPDAKIVPIILKIDTSTSSVQALAKSLDETCHDCLLVASVDFSHYQPAVLANEHDKLTLRALQNLDEDLIRTKAEVDSPPSLQLLMQWARSHETQRFNLWKHTNSGELLHDPDIETTTHIFGYYDHGTQVQPEKRISFLIGGDMMFARGIHYRFQKNLRESVEHLGDRLFWGTDLALINLEGSISQKSVAPDPSPTFHFVFPPETAKVLTYLHLNAISLDNNHSDHVDPRIPDIPILPTTVEGEGLKITVIGINTLWGVKDIKDQISKIKEDSDQRVIIFPHWGVEYAPIHSQQQQDLAHTWIDAGADLVIGSHPHVIQDGEIYKGKPIIYSLGNLLFDQNWSVETQQGMLVGGAFTDDGLELFGLPVISKNFKPELARGALKARLLKKIDGAMLKP